MTTRRPTQALRILSRLTREAKERLERPQTPNPDTLRELRNSGDRGASVRRKHRAALESLGTDQGR